MYGSLPIVGIVHIQRGRGLRGNTDDQRFGRLIKGRTGRTWDLGDFKTAVGIRSIIGVKQSVIDDGIRSRVKRFWDIEALEPFVELRDIDSVEIIRLDVSLCVEEDILSKNTDLSEIHAAKHFACLRIGSGQ
ncbi:hypothetical protein WICPIJ_008340 [Wickerhamomyces pijperi]|uniref:Uncharacterized protein n=1 Tax=Wickerhamomyces pijperi TaxID=599730 RepID=A0A9P8PXE3_WICPI|nr:hypothetical protein WICPIJ_008340 [Wickerhamomyces pijperi]